MNKTMIVYLDDKGNEVPEEQATKINIVEYDKNGNRVKETFMMKSRELTAEEAKKYWGSFDDYESEFLKHSVRVEQTPNPNVFKDEDKEYYEEELF